MHSKKGFYRPSNPKKYSKGDVNNIVFRSGLEFRFMSYLDSHPEVVCWASEEPWFIVPYRDPTTGRARRYFPDFWFEKRNPDNTTTKFLVEVKPYDQTLPPKMKANKNGKYSVWNIKAMNTFLINSAKWESAKKICDKRGDWTFVIITERDLKSI